VASLIEDMDVNRGSDDIFVAEQFSDVPGSMLNLRADG
jgi:hypothetical protein